MTSSNNDPHLLNPLRPGGGLEETSTTINVCSGDIYEYDGSAGSASRLLVDDIPQEHNLCGTGDYDWVSFQAEAGTEYILQTLYLGGTTDTILTLIAADGASQLAENDNINSSHPGSFIRWRAQSDNILYGRVRHADSQVTGNAVTYSIQVSTVSKLFLPVVRR